MGLDGSHEHSTDAASIRPFADPRRLLLIWLSPSFPVGAFAYSQGLEKAVEHGLVRTRADLQSWMTTLIEHGALRTDLTLAAAAWRSATARQRDDLVAANELACALQPSAERYLETTQQGGSFLLAITSAWSTPDFASLRSWLEGPVAYPIAVAMAVAAHGVPLIDLLEAYALAWAGTVTSAAIRLSVIGQTDAQVILAALAGKLTDAARRAADGSLHDLGIASFSADLCSLEHETQYSRLFRS